MGALRSQVCPKFSHMSCNLQPVPSHHSCDLYAFTGGGATLMASTVKWIKPGTSFDSKVGNKRMTT